MPKGIEEGKTRVAANSLIFFEVFRKARKLQAWRIYLTSKFHIKSYLLSLGNALLAQQK